MDRAECMVELAGTKDIGSIGVVCAMWPHERLVAYRKGMDAAAELHVISRRIPFARRDLREQLARASASIPLNIAEGASEPSMAEKAKYFRIARRSAAECSAILDLLGRLGSADPREQEARALLREVALMLTALIHRPPPR